MSQHPKPAKAWLLFVFAGFSMLLNSGCLSGMRTKSLLHDAYYQHELGDNSQALKCIKRGVRSAAWPGVPGYAIIETYDDAGLYYYLNNQPHEAFVHQAVAVLLAEVYRSPENMRRVYRQRLLLALSACHDINLEGNDIDRDIMGLLTIPEVKSNPIVQRYY